MPTTTHHPQSKADLISRDDLLIALESIGVVLPSSTKISNEELTKKLTSALDAAQDIAEYLPEKTGTGLDLREYDMWPADEDVAQATMKEPARTITLTEQMRRMNDSGGLSTAKKDTFKELRQIVMAIAHGVKDGQRHFCLIDDQRVWGVYVRAVEVRKVEEKPIFVLLYKEVFSTATTPFTVPMPELLGESEPVAGITGIKTTELERMVMLKLFRHNAKRLPSDYLPISRTEARRKLGLRVSFVLPLVPPHMKILGKLSENSGCEVCGNPEIKRCAQCLTVAYCSPECQKADWKTHKETCKSLAGGTWRTIRFEATPKQLLTFDNAEKTLKRSLNTSTIVSDHLPLSYIPENIHHGKSFLVKIQVAYTNKDSMLIYDRQRTFTVMWFRKSDPALHVEVQKLIGPTLKTYRWARRVSDYELEVCFDRSPSPTPVW